MILLLTILSVLAGWLMLTLLILGLLLILKPLDSVRRNLQQIAMGVRAIESQTLPLGVRAEALRESLGEAATSVDSTAEHLSAVALGLEAAAPDLQRRS